MKAASFTKACFYSGLLASCAAAFCTPAHADLQFVQENVMPRTKIDIKQPVSEDDPVMLSADNVDYEQDNDVVVASGSVEVNQNETILLADQVIYDRKNNVVTAHGNVAVLDPSGNVYFADDLELRDKLQAGVVKKFKTRLADESLLTGASATRYNEQVTELVKASYSPCKIDCQKPGESSPSWLIRAEHATVDRGEERVRYDDAHFELFGMPMLYTPYFSHRLPGAGNQSGLLKPEYEHTSNLGAVAKLPFYYSVAPDKDLTITPAYLGKEAPVLEGEYRQMFNTGSFKINGSITNPKSRDSITGAQTNGNDLRGHVDTYGEFRPTDATRWGFDVHRTSDDTYLRRYRYNDNTLLTSRAYGEKFDLIKDNDRNYASIQAVSFQGLTSADKGKRIPYAMPMMDFNYESDAGKYGSRFYTEGNALLLNKQDGSDTRRLSGTLGWRLPYITDSGQIIEFGTHLRNDIYYVEDVTLSNGRVFNGTTGRMVPQVDVSWRYPFINRGENASIMVEPTVALAVSPNGGNPEKLPNEDSLVPEFTDSNLFDSNRFSGYDRIESGPRISYGLRSQAQVLRDKYIDVLIGQNYRTNNDPSFPFSNYPSDRFSDYVGKIGITSGPVMLAYRTRLDKEDLSAKRNELTAGVNYKPVSASVSYLSLNKDPVLASKKEVSGIASLELTDEWSLITYGRKDLQLDQTTSSYGGATYKNECISISTVVGKEYTQDRDIKPSTNVLVKFSLKNLN